MAEFIGNYVRTKMCGEFRATEIGSEVVCMGFVGKYRNLGNLLFIDVRDRTGIVQVSFDSTTPKEIFDKAEKLRNEFVVCIAGTVVSRGSNINKNLPSGEVEIIAKDLKILSEAEVAPFVINEELSVGEQTRLKYRYLDLRRPSIQNILMTRSKITKIVHNFLSDKGFIEIETPILGKSTPEGARDYLVPSRVHQGEFYALPQSPQLFKQLLMIAGMDRYYQIVKCFRDEDLRANRQPEFTQIDLEMSYVEKSEDIIKISEELIKKVFEGCLDMTFDEEFPRVPYKYAMETYGSDKPDTRFDLKINDVSEEVKNCTFSMFTNAISSGGSVRAINAKGLASVVTRKQIDAFSEFIKSYGAKGVSFISLKAEGISSSIAKYFSEEELQSIFTKMNAENGDLLLFVADKNKVVLDSLGALRCNIANTFNLYDKNNYNFLWVTDFPLLEYDEDDKRFVAVHHPFTSVKPEDLELLDSNPILARADAYDLVINGEEAGGGSIRIHDYKMQEKMFGLLGFTPEDIKARFGFFVDAFKYGAPPHGGLAFGLDRLVMLVTKTENIKDVIAFPKVQNASCLMSDAPSEVEEKQLKELALSVKK